MGKVIYYSIIVIFFLGGYFIVIAAFYPNLSPYASTAEGYLKGLTAVTPENQRLWGMSDFKIFGRSFIFNQNSPTESVKSNTLEDVTIPVWITGHTLNGESGNWMRNIHIIVKLDNKEYFVESVSLDEARILTFGHQAAVWIFWSLLGPTVILFYIYIFLVDKSLSALATLQVIVSVLALPLAGYLGYVFFNSSWAIWIGVLVYLLLGYLYLKLFRYLMGRLLKFLQALF